MKAIFLRLKKDERGQSLVLLALGMAVFLGFAAISVEYGYLAVQKRNIQNAADAAALAGAQLLYDVTEAKTTAIEVANDNKGSLSYDDYIVNPITPYSGDNSKIEVEIEATIPAIFSRIWGKENSELSARAVAKQNWDGQALPFINIGYDYTKNNPVLRFLASPGDKAQIADYYIIPDGNGINDYGVMYQDGVEVVQGQGNVKSNIDGTPLNSLLEDIFGKKNQTDPPAVGTKFYLFSVKSDILDGFLNEDKPIITEDGDEVYYEPSVGNGGFKNGDIIKREDIVLLEVEFVSIKQSNHSELELRFLNEYTLYGTDFPPEYTSEGVGYSYLVE